MSHFPEEANFVSTLSAVGLALASIPSLLASSTFVGSDDGGGVSSLKSDKWANWHSEREGTFPQSTQDYVIRLNKTVRAPREAAPFTFSGRSLHVGSNSQGEDGHLGVCAVATSIPATTEFANDGLYLERGYICQFNNWTATIKGKIRVRTDWRPFGIWCWNDIKAGADDYSSAVVFDGPIDGPTGGYLRFALSESYIAPQAGTSTDNRTFRIKGDLSNYLGVLEVREYLDWEESGDKSRTADRMVRLVVDSKTFAGTVRLMRGGILEPAWTADGFSVSNLELRADSALPAVVAGSGQFPCVKVLGELDVRGPVRIIAGRGADFNTDNVEFTVPVLKAPAGVELDIRDFTIHKDLDRQPVDVPVRLYVETDPTDGLSTLYAKKQKRLYQSADDKANASGSFAQDGSLANNWPDGAFPSVDKNYTSFKALRTPTGASTFGGASLTLAYNGNLIGRGSRMRVDDLRIIGNAFLSNYGSGDGSHGVNSFAPGGTMTCEGRIRMTQQNGESLYIDTAVGRYDVIAAEISGVGMIQVRGAGEANANGKYVGWVELAGCNTNYLGKIKVSCTTFANTSYGIDMPSMTQHERLVIRDGRNLGGRLSAFAFDALTLEAYSQLWPRADVVLDDATRGIYVKGIGRFRVDEGTTFAVKVPITYDGELIKEGSGLLQLGGTPLFGAAAGTAPQSGLNKLTVAEGAVEPVGVQALSGLNVTMENGTTWQVDLSNEALRSLGADLTAEGSSLSVSSGSVNVSLVDRRGTSKPAEFGRFVPICTVSAALAPALREKLVVVSQSPWSKHDFNGIKTRTNANGTVTLGVAVEGPGLAVILR